MSKLPEAVIEAARVYTDDRYDMEVRARRVINALAENLPDSAVDAGLFSYETSFCRGDVNNRRRIKLAIVAALKDIVEGE